MNSGAGAADPNAGLPRIVVAAPMKSGSSYVSLALCLYFHIENPILTAYDWQTEHTMSHELLEIVRGRPFCQNFHMLPHAGNIAALARETIGFVGLWRNLGDMIVSLDDHLRREPGSGPALFLFDPRKYPALDTDARHRFLIDAVVPWYLGFYLRWRAVNVVLRPYERMVEDRHTFFRELMVESFNYHPVPERLDATLAMPSGPIERLNVGRAGRSAEKLSDANKRRLEERVLEHPDAAQLEILLWELPWEVPALARVSPLDGQVVQAMGSAPRFISRGVAYPVTPTWLATRFGARRTPSVVPEQELAGYPVGEQLL